MMLCSPDLTPIVTPVIVVGPDQPIDFGDPRYPCVPKTPSKLKSLAFS